MAYGQRSDVVGAGTRVANWVNIVVSAIGEKTLPIKSL